MADAPTAAPGWYPDPNTGQQRYWDGASWGPTAPQQQYVQPSGNGFAVTALVCGIIGAVLALIPLLFILGWALGLVALIFGILGWRKANSDPTAGKKGMAIAGTILGVVAIGLGIAGAAIIDDVGEDLENLGEPEETKSATLGEPLELETQDTTIEVTPGTLRPVEGGRFDSDDLIGLDLQITNTGDAAFEDSVGNDVELIATGGEKADSAYVTGGPCEAFSDIRLDPGDTASGCAAFEAPAGTPETFIFTPDSGFAPDAGEWAVP